MKFIKLSARDYTIVTVNPERIEAFYRSSSNITEILTSSGSTIYVHDFPEEIEAKIACIEIEQDLSYADQDTLMSAT